jgi:DHA3 family multidrug efflux protein-like MFS transporter
MGFVIREWWWLYAVGILIFMTIMPIAEAAEQTIIQRVVPYDKQGRVFGFAASVESAAAPISAFIVGPIAQFWLIPFMESTAGQDAFGWLLGDGEARGIALVFVIVSALLLVVVLLAFASRPYRELSRAYAEAPPSLETVEAAAAAAADTTRTVAEADTTRTVAAADTTRTDAAPDETVAGGEPADRAEDARSGVR